MSTSLNDKLNKFNDIMLQQLQELKETGELETFILAVKQLEESCTKIQIATQQILNALPHNKHKINRAKGISDFILNHLFTNGDTTEDILIQMVQEEFKESSKSRAAKDALNRLVKDGKIFKVEKLADQSVLYTVCV